MVLSRTDLRQAQLLFADFFTEVPDISHCLAYHPAVFLSGKKERGGYYFGGSGKTRFCGHNGCRQSRRRRRRLILWLKRSRLRGGVLWLLGRGQRRRRRRIGWCLGRGRSALGRRSGAGQPEGSAGRRRRWLVSREAGKGTEEQEIGKTGYKQDEGRKSPRLKSLPGDRCAQQCTFLLSLRRSCRLRPATAKQFNHYREEQSGS